LLIPAAEILRAAVRSLPILRLGEFEDPRPLMRPHVNDEVPWAAAGVTVGAASPSWAGVYLAGTLVPLLLLVRLGSRRRRRR
jgi:hypothetical protein